MKLLSAFLLSVFLCGCSGIVFANVEDHSKEKPIRLAEITNKESFQEQAVRAILGEGEDQGYIGMLCLGEAIRNRETLKGVYGYKIIVVKDDKYFRKTKKGLREIDYKIVEQARKAWAESENTDWVHGADHWENVKAFGMPTWAKDMRIMFEHKDHVFFKE